MLKTPGSPGSPGRSLILGTGDKHGQVVHCAIWAAKETTYRTVPSVCVQRFGVRLPWTGGIVPCQEALQHVLFSPKVHEKMKSMASAFLSFVLARYCTFDTLWRCI